MSIILLYMYIQVAKQMLRTDDLKIEVMKKDKLLEQKNEEVQ